MAIFDIEDGQMVVHTLMCRTCWVHTVLQEPPMSSVGLRTTARGGQALKESPIEGNGTTEDGSGVPFQESIGLMCQLHCHSTNQGQCAYKWHCQYVTYQTGHHYIACKGYSYLYNT
jgi:hypothetical protein